jgi:hypothetical protein
MIRPKIISLLLFAVLPLSLQAKTIVISDIDDTIRETHVLSRKKLIAPLKLQPAFHGMPEVYQALKKKGEIDFYYLTSAPQKIMKRSHTKFLIENYFPDGKIKLRSLFNSENHKLNSIREIISTNKMDTLVLIGDNGEKDPEIYNNIKNFIDGNELKIKVLSYIKVNYPLHANGSIIFEGQIPFMVGAELAYILRNEGLIDEDISQNIIATALNNNGALITPLWVRPSQYSSNFKIEDILSNDIISKIQTEIDRISQ